MLPSSSRRRASQFAVIMIVWAAIESQSSTTCYSETSQHLVGEIKEAWEKRTGVIGSFRYECEIEERRVVSRTARALGPFEDEDVHAGKVKEVTLGKELQVVYQDGKEFIQINHQVWDSQKGAIRDQTNSIAFNGQVDGEWIRNSTPPS